MDDGKILYSVLGAKTAEDFLPRLHRAPIMFGQVIGDQHTGICEDAERVLLADTQAQQNVVAIYFAIATRTRLIACMEQFFAQHSGP